ncbi:MAG: hypothetical protein CMO80_12000 [Verrucomicrobiales bacterium]|nr:hypothetical protein [Verrucomicrobiales bacterium]|tara:strand:- start:4945 stop:5244 length:300 start_codon:yes stop_codon:yes gene_type:complete
MPVNIYRSNADGEFCGVLDFVCAGEWDLSEQIAALSGWIAKADLPAAHYVADVSFRWRRDAGGGGSALGADTLQRLANLGIELHLSEYPGLSDPDGRAS